MDRGVIITNADGKILLTNAVADRILSACDGLKCCGSRLTAWQPSESQKLNRMIASASAPAGTHSIEPGSVLTVSLPSQTRSLEVFVCPARSRDIGYLKTSGALVVITDLDNSRQLSFRALRELFGSTTAEARLASALATGTKLADAAVRFGVSRESIRTQLKSIFLKTGTDRQSDLTTITSCKFGSPV